jgi:hypothetical protein
MSEREKTEVAQRNRETEYGRHRRYIKRCTH